MRKRLHAFVILYFLTMLSISCSFSPGKVYQKYWWAGALKYFSDTNPSTPSTIYNNKYFISQPGKFYLQYIAFDNSAWYTYYTLEANPATATASGADVWYELALYSFGPSLYKFAYEKSINTENMDTESNIEIKNSTGLLNMVEGPILGEEEREYKNGKITIRYGKLY